VQPFGGSCLPFDVGHGARVARAPRALRGGSQKRHCAALRSKQIEELSDGDPRFADQRSQSALREFAVIGNREPPERGIAVAQNDMTALLAIDLVSELAERRDRFSSGDAR
jgi:hypothetical protein